MPNQTYDAIPDELKALNQWVCWRFVPDADRPGKVKKLPIDAATGKAAESNNPGTWHTYAEAAAAAPRYDGIGFMFDNGYFGVDLDNAADAIQQYRNGMTDKTFGNIISEFIHGLQSYAEYSVSGNGLHIICRGSLPPGGRRKGNIEMYSSGRFFIMTGDAASEYTAVTDCTERIKPLHEKYIGGGAEPAMQPEQPVSLAEQDIIERAMASKQGRMFTDLYNGRWQEYFTSQSEADMSFCNMLAFWCRKDTAVMDRIFRASGLMREKWERLGRQTIDKAVKDCMTVYEPQGTYRITIGSSKTVVKPRKKYTLDDTGNAQRFTDLFGEAVRFSYLNNSWFYYDGRKWVQDHVGATLRMIDQTVEALGKDLQLYLSGCDDEREMEKVFNKHVKHSRSHNAKTAMLKQAQHHVPILPEEFDRHALLLNTPGGTVDLASGMHRAHDRNDFITKIAFADYQAIPAPRWLAFLHEIFNGDADMIRFIQKAVGYSLTGETSEDCMFFCFGNGRNGKSTFLEVVRDILGDYATNIQPETLMVKAVSGSATSDIARLKGARMVTASEPSEGMRFNEGLVKQLTGGDTVTASKKYENEIEFRPSFKLWMSGNHKPIIRGTDLGIWSRIRLIPFTAKFTDDKCDKGLPHKLKQEAAGILGWAVEGCLLWQREGLSPPAVVQQATDEYRSEMDVLTSFIAECCRAGYGETKATDLFQAYLKWADENNEFKMTNTRFGREMKGRFEKVHKMTGWYYAGLAINEDYRRYGVSFSQSALPV